MAWTDLLPQPQAPTPNIGANPNALLQLQLNQLRLNEARQEIAGQNMLRQAAGDTSNFANGQFQPTGNALARIFQADPETGLKVQNALSTLRYQQSRNALLGAQVQEAEREKVLEASLPARAKFEEVFRATGDKERAQREATEVLKEQLAPVLPTLSQPARTMLGESPAFNYENNTRNLLTSTRFRQALAEERKEKFEGYTKTEEIGPGGTPRTIYTAPGKPSLDMAGNPVTPTGQAPFKGSEQPPLYNVTTSDGKDTKTVIGRRAPNGGFVNDDTGEKISNVVGATQLGRGGQSASPEAARATAEAIYEYRQPPLSSYAMKSGTGPEILRQLEEIGKERGRPYDAKKYSAAKVLMDGYSRDTPSSPGGQMLSINTATQHLEQMQKLAAGLKNHDPPALNYVVNYARTQLGHPEVTNYDTAAQIVADEVLKSVIGSGAVFDREKLLGQLTNTRSPDQIEGGISTIKGLMGGRVNSLRKQWDSVGLPEDDFTAKLTDQSKDALMPYLPTEGGKQGAAGSGVVRLGNDQAENQRKMATAPGGTTFQFPDGSTLTKPQR